MSIALPKLPYDLNALEPHISAKTMSFHYDRHHRGYVDKLNKLIAGSDYESLSLDKIIERARKDNKVDILNNACQAWNHEFYWHSMTPKRGTAPGGKLKELIDAGLGGIGGFNERFRNHALNRFGSGWVWLVAEKDKLGIISTANAETPVGTELEPLLVLDVWEHAYYLDYQNERKRYTDAFLDKLINWEFAAANLKASHLAEAA